MKPTKTNKVNKKLPAYMDESTFLKLLRNTISQHHKIAFLLAFESGLRISEVTNLEKEDFEIERNMEGKYFSNLGSTNVS